MTGPPVMPARRLYQRSGPLHHEVLSRQFFAAGYRTVQTDSVTWRRQPLVLDHIFYSRHLRPVRHAVKPTPASDHHTVVDEFEFVDR